MFAILAAKKKPFQSTLPVGGATFDRANFFGRPCISIHAPRGGSDTQIYNHNKLKQHFNPRSPWGERHRPKRLKPMIKEFQSTLPVGGATLSDNSQPQIIDDFNPRSPWGERQIRTGMRISIIAFQSTLPVGGATNKPESEKCFAVISIHAPRGGSDVIKS